MLQAQCLILSRLFGIYTQIEKIKLAIGALTQHIGDLMSTFPIFIAKKTAMQVAVETMTELPRLLLLVQMKKS